MTSPLTLYECSLCHVYFKNPQKVTIHLERKHSERKTILNRNHKEEDADLINATKFPKCFIRIRRISSDQLIAKESSSDLNTAKKTTTRKPRHKKAPGRQEIKLDTLKAGEIETLVADLFNNVPASSTTNSESGQTFVRRSNRKVKERIQSNYEELNSDDEEIIKTGSGGSRSHSRKKAKRKKDEDYIPSCTVANEDSISNCNEEDTDGNEENPVPVKRQAGLSVQETLDEHIKSSGMKMPKGRNDPHECPACHRIFANKYGLYRHYMVHLNNKQFKCEFPGCCCSFTEKYRLTKHKAIHKGGKLFLTCEFCPATFVRTDAIRNHIVKAHPRKAKTAAGSNVTKSPAAVLWWCHVCNLKFPHQMKNYLTHMKKEHMKDGKYVCIEADCRNEFDGLQNFNRHLMNVHIVPRRNGNVPKEKNECKICGKLISFSKYQDNMALHISNVHDKKRADDPTKPHQCPICQHRFTRKCGLKRHFVYHLENNPHKCLFPGCNKQFTNACSLKVHVALHSERTRFNCEKCPAYFSAEERLRNHVKKYHSGNSKKKYIMKKRTLFVKSIHDLAPTNEIETTAVENSVEEEKQLRFELESVHLTDKIIATDGNGKDIHIKGEKLSPERRREIERGPSSPSSHRSRSRSLSPSLSNDDDDENMEKSFNPLLPNSSMQLHKQFESDPTVKKIKETNPDILKSGIRGFFYNKHRKVADFKCQMCSWTGERAFSFQNHMKKHHGAAPAAISVAIEPTPENPLAISLLCGSCGYQSKSSDDLAVHMTKVHGGAKKYHCSYCGIRFTKLAPRDEHVKRVHLTERKFKCNKCSSAYHSFKQLKTHRLEKHDPEFQKKLKIDCECKICGRILCNKNSLTAHMKLHLKPRETIVSCQICGQNAATAEALKRHIQYIHLGVQNPYRRKRKGELAVLESQGKAPSETPATADSQEKQAELDKTVESGTATETEGLTNEPTVQATDSTEILGF